MVFAQTKHPMREALEDLLESSYIPQNHRFLDSSEKFSRLSRNLSELQNYFYGICESTTRRYVRFAHQKIYAQSFV